MISSGFNEFNGALQLCNHASDSNSHKVYAISLPFIRRGFVDNVRLFRRGICSIRNYRFSVVCATPQDSIMDHIAPISHLNSDDSKKLSSKSGNQ